ncbi:MAG: xylulokinase [Phycisphaerae bacterium]|nr:xylulokinase [Phycisphaerae bacterium]
MLIGLDVGTSSTKALLVAPDGAVVAAATREYGFDTPRPGWAQTDPRVWRRASIAVLRELAGHPRAKSIQCIGLTGQMHGLCLVGDDGEPLAPAIMWNDQRSAPQCDRLERLMGAPEIVARTGNRLMPGFTAPKWAWVVEHEPSIARAARHVLLPKDDVRFALTGTAATDVSDASGMLVLDCASRRWSKSMCHDLALPMDLLGSLHESHEVCAHLNAAAAAATGLPAGLPVVAGAGDQAAQALGTGIIDDGQVSCTIGTSGVVFAAGDRWRASPDGNLHAFCHAVPNRWHLMGVMLSAGGSLQWAKRALAPDLADAATNAGVDAYPLMLELAAAAPAGCDGLIFLPYLSGERTPHADPHARGAFVGMTPAHSRHHLLRAVVEGITMGLVDGLDAMRAVGLTPRSIRLSGGGARSAWWRQLMTDAFGVPTSTVQVTDGGAYGAALLAGIGTGCWTDAAHATRHLRDQDACAPSGINAMPQDRYRAAYRALRPWFHEAHP